MTVYLSLNMCLWVMVCISKEMNPTKTEKCRLICGTHWLLSATTSHKRQLDLAENPGYGVFHKINLIMERNLKHFAQTKWIVGAVHYQMHYVITVEAESQLLSLVYKSRHR